MRAPHPCGRGSPSARTAPVQVQAPPPPGSPAEAGTPPRLPAHAGARMVLPTTPGPPGTGPLRRPRLIAPGRGDPIRENPPRTGTDTPGPRAIPPPVKPLHGSPASALEPAPARRSAPASGYGSPRTGDRSRGRKPHRTIHRAHASAAPAICMNPGGAPHHPRPDHPRRRTRRDLAEPRRADSPRRVDVTPGGSTAPSVMHIPRAARSDRSGDLIAARPPASLPHG